MEELKCDIAHVLQNRDFSVLQKFLPFCCNLRTKIAAKIEHINAYEIQCAEKRKQNINKISELQHEVENLKSEIDDTKLKQKIVDKKIVNALKEQEILNQDIQNEKLKRDSLALEMVDLQQESEKRKEEKKFTWESLKHVCYVYKKNLDFCIQLVDSKGSEQIKIFFFINDPHTKDKYFVLLNHSNNQWRVKEMQPMLKAEHWSNFKGIVDLSKELEISNITAFLYKLRHTFVEYYLNTE